MNRPTVCFLVPNRNGVGFLRKCYESIAEQKEIEPEIILLDQASEDDSVAFTEKNFPEVHIIKVPASFGYAPCMSTGIGASKSEWVILFNNDAWLGENWGAAFVGSIAKYPDRRVFAVAGYCATEVQKYYTLGELIHEGAVYRVGYKEDSVAHPIQPMPEEVVYSSGYCGIYHRTVLEKTGLMVDAFDTYYEDVDLGLRSFRLGFRCWLIKEAVVFHVGGASGHFLEAESRVVWRQRFASSWKSGRNEMWFMRRHYPQWRHTSQKKRVLQNLWNNFKWGVVRGSAANRGRFFGMLRGLFSAYPKDYLERLPAGRDFEMELERIWELWRPWMEGAWGKK